MNRKPGDNTSPILLTDEIQSLAEELLPVTTGQGPPPRKVDEGHVIQVKHPLQGEIEGMTITLLGTDSEVFRVAMREREGWRLKRMADGFAPESAENAETAIEEAERNLEFLLNLTLGWTGFLSDGKEILCTPENVRRFYSDPGYLWLYDQVWTHLFELEYLASIPDFGSVIGQKEVVSQLCKLVELHKRANQPVPNILLVGPVESGKSTIARAFAKEVGAGLREMNGPCSRESDGLRFLTILNGKTLLIRDVGRLSSLGSDFARAIEKMEVVATVKRPSGKDGQLESAIIKMPLKRFTCIATVEGEVDCTARLRNLFPLVIRLQKYSDSELSKIIHKLAFLQGIEIEPAAANLVATVADGSVKRARLMIKRFELLSKPVVTVDDVAEVLAAFEGDVQRWVTASGASSDLASMSGVDFERLVISLFRKMGFVAE